MFSLVYRSISDFHFFFLLSGFILLSCSTGVILGSGLNIGEKRRGVNATGLVQLSNHYFLASCPCHAQMLRRTTNLSEVFHLRVHDLFIVVHVDFGEADLGRAALLLELK